MHFLVAGVSHNSAPIERLQRLAINRRSLPDLIQQGTLHAGDIAILSTCNRTEIYSYNPDKEAGERQLLEFLEIIDQRLDPGAAPLSPYVFSLSDDEAIRHLFRVTSGLDALVLGEPEIVGQVSYALRAAGEAKSISPHLSRLFHHAIRTSRKVRSSTDIGRARVSVSSIGVDLLTRSLGSLEDHSVLVVGAGETGMQAARALRRNGVGDIIVTSRRSDRAMEAAAELGSNYVDFEDIQSTLKTVDAIVTCTAAETSIISTEIVRDAMSARDGRGLFFLDLAMPADVEAGVREISGVTVFGLGDLTEIAEVHRNERRNAADDAETIVEDELQHFKELLVGAASEPLIKALGEQADSMREAEMARALKRLPNLTDADRAVIDAMSRAIVKKLLADPIAYLRETDDLESSSAVARAFDLPEDSEAH
ncbi:MAG: glutamyl-tRNA reductase [Chloroflexi bacterium]|nr:glutamyl-tRNA reductase [Chloroflexota bacterium]